MIFIVYELNLKQIFCVCRKPLQF